MSLLQSTVVPGDDGTIRVTLEGEFDSYSADDLRDWLVDASRVHGTRIEIDLNDVTFIDSGGLAALIAGAKWLRRTEGELVLRRPTEAAMRVFEITGLNKVFCFG